MRPLIGLPAGELLHLNHPKAPLFYGQQHTYVEAIIRAGGVPIIIPLTQDKATQRELYELCDGILFAGGNDLNPALYGEKVSPYTKELSPPRDALEQQLLVWALDDDKPALCICRGLQLLNVVLGGDLYQHIPADLPAAGVHKIEHGLPDDRKHQIVHQLKIKSGSRLAEILGAEEIGANAYHHQAIKSLGKGLMATAWTPDGVIEAVELPGKSFVLGVQSHPETLQEKIEPEWRKLFTAFTQAVWPSSQLLPALPLAQPDLVH